MGKDVEVIMIKSKSDLKSSFDIAKTRYDEFVFSHSRPMTSDEMCGSRIDFAFLKTPCECRTMSLTNEQVKEYVALQKEMLAAQNTYLKSIKDGEATDKG